MGRHVSDNVAPASTEQAGDRLRPWLTYPAWGICLLLAVLAPVFPAAAQRIQFYPFALGLVLLGLPHGALDHLAGPYLLCRPLTLRFLLRFIAGYLAAVLLFLAFWHVCPPAALVAFLLLSWLHWGQGDYDYLRLFEGLPRPRTWGGTLRIWLVRGGLPILLPILVFPAVFARLGASVTRWYGGVGLPVPGRGVILGGVAVLLFLTLLSLRQSWRDGGGAKRLFLRDFWELLLLWALFGRVTPILAVGAYFCVWHSARHLGRLMLLDPVTADLIARGRWVRGVGRTALQCLPMTLGAMLLLVGLYVFLRHHSSASLPTLTALYLSLIAALTVPHFAVVLWMDRRQRL